MTTKLRIAQVAPLYESVPPKMYGGTERVVYNLCEELIQLGHDVTLFATGDSETSCRLIATTSEGLRQSGVREALAPHLMMFERVRALAAEFDIVHFHNEYMHFPVARQLPVPTVSTLHGRLDFFEYRDLFREFADLPLVSISENQRQPLPDQNWAATIHHGMPANELPFNPYGGDYLAFLGRISPEKGVEQAIAIARQAGLPLKIAAKIERYDYDYYLRLKEELSRDGVEFLGEIGQSEKAAFLGGAKALLFPITWPEPFGLVMIEALACGTPVVAFRNGSVPEVICDGETGFIVDDVAGAVSALAKIDSIQRAECRRHFESRFTVQRMARDYVDIYEHLIESHVTEILPFLGEPRLRVAQSEQPWNATWI